MKNFILWGCAFLFVACQSESGLNQALKPPPVPDEQPKAEFVERYKRYRCAEDELPVVEESKGPGQRFRSMQFGEHLVLKLELGKLVRVNGTASGAMRTKSRYRLFWDKTQIGEAESLFSTTDDGENRTSVEMWFNSESQSVLIFEELEWTTKRCIVFERSKESTLPEKWTVKYISPPSRSRAYSSPTSEDGKIRGIGNGMLFLEMDGLLYAFPFDDFPLNELEFTVG